MSEMLALISLYASVNNTADCRYSTVAIAHDGSLIVKTVDQNDEYVYAFVVTLPDLSIIGAYKLREFSDDFEDAVETVEISEPTIITCIPMLKSIFTASQVADIFKDL